MFNTISEVLIFYQVVSYNKRYSNLEIKLYNFFHDKTKGIYPNFIVVLNNFVFFFVNNNDYFRSIYYLDSMRRMMKNKKILIVRAESVLINLIFSLFPDLYVHDIALELNDDSMQAEISLYFLTFKERGIAIGKGGNYIKCVNQLFKNYIKFSSNQKPLEICCKCINIEV